MGPYKLKESFYLKGRFYGKTNNGKNGKFM